MYTYLKALLTLLLFLALASCTSGEMDEKFQTKDSCLKISPYSLNILSSKEESYSFEKFVTLTNIIQLQTDLKDAITIASKAFFLENRYYILDKKFDSFKAFDSSGNYLFSFGEIGAGPGEFLNINDVAISSDSSIFTLYSNESQKILHFDLEGNFMNSIALNFYAKSFCYFSEKKFAFFTNANLSDASGNYNLLLVDLKGRVTNRLMPIDLSSRGEFGVSYSGLLTSNGKDVIYSEPYSDTVFQVTENAICPKYILELGEKKLPSEYMVSMDKMMANSMKFSFIKSNFLETDTWFLFTYSEDQQDFFAMLDKANNKLFRRRDFKESSFKKLISTPIGIKDDNKFIGYIDHRIFSYYKNNDPQFMENLTKESPLLFNILKTISDEDNTVLIEFEVNRIK